MLSVCRGWGNHPFGREKSAFSLCLFKVRDAACLGVWGFLSFGDVAFLTFIIGPCIVLLLFYYDHMQSLHSSN